MPCGFTCSSATEGPLFVSRSCKMKQVAFSSVCCQDVKAEKVTWKMMTGLLERGGDITGGRWQTRARVMVPEEAHRQP